MYNHLSQSIFSTIKIFMISKAKRYKLYLFLTLLTIGLTGCQVASQTVINPETITPQPNLGVIIGQLDPIPERWEDQAVYAFSASYLGDPEGEGIMALDENLHPKDVLDNYGWFQIENIPPGYYVMVFGPNSEEVAVYRQGGSAVKVKVEAGKVVDLGNISVEP